MEEKRIKLYQAMKSDGLKRTYKDFISTYFSNTQSFDILYNALIDAGDYTKSLTSFYKDYACDLPWAKTTTYCGGSGGGGNTNTSTWDDYPCVVELAKSKGVSLGSDNSYMINGFKYFTTGYKYDRVGKSSKFKCDDPQFKKDNGGGGGGGSNPLTDGWVEDPTGNQTWE